MGGTVAIPVWAFPLALTFVIAAATFLWGLASRANRAADALEEATRRLLALESRIAVIAALETAMAVVRTQLDAALTMLAEQRQRVHDLSTHCTVTRGAHDALVGRVAALEGDVRASLHPSRS